mgnify:CR=1 FL=1
MLQIKAELEGVASFRVPPESVLEIDVKQSAGDEERKGVQVDPEESHEVPNSKNATANFMVKFPGDKAPSTLSLISLKGLPFRAQTADDTGMVPIAAFECRGMEPTKWHPTGYYVVEALSGALYDEVGFKDGEDWCEYDEKSGESMMVSNNVESSRPEASANSPSSTPRQRQIKLRAASSLGQLGQSADMLWLAGRPHRPCLPYTSRVAPAVAEKSLAVARAKRVVELRSLHQGCLHLCPSVSWATGSLRWRDLAQLETHAGVRREAPRTLLLAPRVAAVVVPAQTVVGEVEVRLGVLLRRLVSVKAGVGVEGWLRVEGESEGGNDGGGRVKDRVRAFEPH